MKKKVIAFYLPQFHAIAENDAWWGKGFTDWVNVRRARPLFAGHRQPKVPLGGQYYDLSEPDALRRQAQMAEAYGVYGMCFYHYWFDGKMLLERPAELLLQHEDITMRFCFSWANEPWARTWDGKNHQVLMPQRYGGEADWRKHFAYLLPFFRDKRYIKVGGRPMFLIYRSQSMPDACAMMNLWDALAREAGFEGMHFVETLRSPQTDTRELPFRARVEFEPARALNHRPLTLRTYGRVRRRVVNLINKVCHTALPLNPSMPFADVAACALAHRSPEGTYGGVFCGWDNSPRRGLAATIILPPTRQEFAAYLAAKCQACPTEFLFVNAWNEWAEGTVLEPSEENQYAYLEAIRDMNR